MAEWDGKFEPEALTNAPVEADIVLLANRDKVMGKVLTLDAEKTTVETKQTTLDIPLDRVTQIRFGQGPDSATNFTPREVRATFPGGESLVFEIEKWDPTEVRGTSRVFGPLTFNSTNIRQLQFNLARTLPPQPEQQADLDQEFQEATRE